MADGMGRPSSVAVLIEGGMPIRAAAIVALEANRMAGRYALPSPATRIDDIIRNIPKALAHILARAVAQWMGRAPLASFQWIPRSISPISVCVWSGRSANPISFL